MGGLSSNRISAQCALASFYGTITPSSGTTFVTVGGYGPGRYFQMPVLFGGSYSVSLCANTMDTQVTGYNNTGGLVFYNDDNGPLCTGLPASTTYVPNFTNYLLTQVSQYNCQPGGSASITVQVRQNNNLTITSSAAAMCSGQTRSLTATPAAVAVATVPGLGNLGTFSGTGVSGITFTAPVVGVPTNFVITYSFWLCFYNSSYNS